MSGGMALDGNTTSTPASDTKGDRKEQWQQQRQQQSTKIVQRIEQLVALNQNWSMMGMAGGSPGATVEGQIAELFAHARRLSAEKTKTKQQLEELRREHANYIRTSSDIVAEKDAMLAKADKKMSELVQMYDAEAREMNQQLEELRLEHANDIRKSSDILAEKDAMWAKTGEKMLELLQTCDDADAEEMKQQLGKLRRDNADHVREAARLKASNGV